MTKIVNYPFKGRFYKQVLDHVELRRQFELADTEFVTGHNHAVQLVILRQTWHN